MPRVPNIILFPAANRDASRNYGWTVAPQTRRVDLFRHRGELGQAYVAGLDAVTPDMTPPMWGGQAHIFNVWNDCVAGDVVFFYKDGGLASWARVVAKSPGPTPGLAQELWQDPAWIYTFVLGRVREFDSVRTLQGLWDYGGYTMTHVQQTMMLRRGNPEEILRYYLGADVTSDLIGDALAHTDRPATSPPADARTALLGLVDTEVETRHGAANRVLAVTDGSVLVGTSRSPDGQAVPIADVQAALADLHDSAEVIIHPSIQGYRSSFIGAFLAHLPGTRFVDDPLRVVLEGVTEETGSDWSPRELALVVDDYLAMLKTELRAEPYSKTKHRARLQGLLPARSESSIEFKHANISSVFEQLGLPRIAGYAPRDSVQAALATEVAEHLAQDAELAELLAQHAGQALPEKKVESFADHVDEEPPRRSAASAGGGAADRAPRTGSYGGSEAERKALGLAGEKWVLKLERLRLTEAGRPDLAARVRHVAVEVGDGLGYDIASFETDEEPRLIEVKTTGAGANSQFFLSSNELAVSQREGDRYFLYRVYRFGTTNPRVYIAQGDLEKSFELAPATFVVRPPRADEPPD